MTEARPHPAQARDDVPEQTPAPLPVFALANGNATAAAVRAKAPNLFRTTEALPAALPLAGEHVLNPDWGTTSSPLKPAAVLFLVAADPRGEPTVLFIERAAHLSSHAGQIGLPGGKLETGELPADTALREAEEEVALPQGAVDLIGLTEAYVTRTGYLVTPVVGVLKTAHVLRPDGGEVAGAFLAPFHHVMNAANLAEISLTFQGRDRRMLEMMWGTRRIWGVTAGILRVVQQRLMES